MTVFRSARTNPRVKPSGKTRIAFVVPDLGGGEAERATIALARGFCERGYRVDLVLSSPIIAYTGELPKKARLFVLCNRAVREQRASVDMPEGTLWRHGRSSFGKALLSAAQSIPACLRGSIPIEMLRLAGDTLLRRHTASRGLRLLAYIEQERPDILFAIIFEAEYAASFAGMIATGSPPVVPIAQNIETLRKKHRRRRRRLIRSAPRVVAASRGVAEDMATVHDVRNDRIEIIYNPAFWPGIVARAKEQPDHSWFSDGGPPVILGVGRLHPQKDFPTLIDAFRLVSAKHSYRLLILGEGSQRGEIESRVETFGLPDRVSLPGWTGNPFAFMSRAALFVLSSRHEGFGNVLVEAMACGCPAVSTDCPSGPAEILEDPTLLAPVGDPEALAQVMLRALDRPVDKTALRARAQRFSVDRAVDGYERLIAEILAERSPR